jgi:hypothetical protein
MSPQLTPYLSTARHWPLNATTVSINGSTYPASSAIWAGLRLHEAEFRGIGPGSYEDQHLRTPWCHINDDPIDGDCFYRVRSRRDDRVFVRAPNGAWVLQEIVNV